ncbi:MAG: hypothetical protein FWE77_03135 [Clostridia bacterium]|nr:hypothetical protein [Clostridia bacterium]
MRGRNKNDVLLTELVIVILVFSLVAVTVLQMFVAARQRSAHSGQVEHALIVAQDWAERIFGAEDPAGLLAGAGFSIADGTDDTFVLERAGSGLIVQARLQPEASAGAGRMRSAMVSVFGGAGYAAEEEAPLVMLPVLRYIPAEEVGP